MTRHTLSGRLFPIWPLVRLLLQKVNPLVASSIQYLGIWQLASFVELRRSVEGFSLRSFCRRKDHEILTTLLLGWVLGIESRQSNYIVTFIRWSLFQIWWFGILLLVDYRFTSGLIVVKQRPREFLHFVQGWAVGVYLFAKFDSDSLWGDLIISWTLFAKLVRHRLLEFAGNDLFFGFKRAVNWQLLFNRGLWGVSRLQITEVFSECERFP